MRTTFETLEAKVLQLSESDRSHLMDRPIISLDLGPAVEQAWEDEAARRDAELESGAVQPVPLDEVMARLRARRGRSDEAISNAERLALGMLADAESGVKVPAGLKAALQQLFHEPVDLVSIGAVENPYIKASSDRSRQLVYASLSHHEVWRAIADSLPPLRQAIDRLMAEPQPPLQL